MHPRLLSAVLFYEPVIRTTNTGLNPALLTTLRHDLWPSRAAAEATLRRAFRTWDPVPRRPTCGMAFGPFPPHSTAKILMCHHLPLEMLPLPFLPLKPSLLLR